MLKTSLKYCLPVGGLSEGATSLTTSSLFSRSLCCCSMRSIGVGHFTARSGWLPVAGRLCGALFVGSLRQGRPYERAIQSAAINRTPSYHRRVATGWTSGENLGCGGQSQDLHAESSQAPSRLAGTRRGETGGPRCTFRGLTCILY